MLRMLKLLQVFSRVLDFVTTDDKPVRKILKANASHRPVTGQSPASHRTVTGQSPANPRLVADQSGLFSQFLKRDLLGDAHTFSGEMR